MLHSKLFDEWLEAMRVLKVSLIVSINLFVLSIHNILRVLVVELSH